MREAKQRETSFVPALVEPKRAPLQVLEHAPIELHTESAYLARDGATEKTSAMDRARALVVRQIWPSALILVGSVFVVWLLGVSSWWVAGLWFLASLAYYLWSDQLDWAHSRNGLERHRIDRATEIQLSRLRHEYGLRREALREFSKAMERREHDE